MWFLSGLLINDENNCNTIVAVMRRAKNYVRRLVYRNKKHEK